MPREIKWSRGETKILAEEKSRYDEDGMWNTIAAAVSERIAVAYSRRPARSARACRNRWDTLVKVYKRIETHCNVTIGGHHLLLSARERKSLILPTAYNEEWYCIVKEVCDRKLAARNASIQPVTPPDDTQAHWDQWADPAILPTSMFGPAMEPAIELEMWLAIEQAMEPAIEQVSEPAIEQANGHANELANEPANEPPDEPANEQPNEQLNDQSNELANELETEPETEEITLYVPSMVESRSPSHMRQFGAPNIAGEHTFGLSPWTSNESALLQLFMSQSMPDQEDTTISSASSNTLDAKQRNHPKK